MTLPGKPPSPRPGAEYRATPRVTVVGTCELVLVGERPPRTLSAPLLNASRGGLAVASEAALDVGTILKVRSLAAQGRSWLVGADARVCWTREKDPTLPQEPAAMGLSFLGLTANAQTIVDAFLRAVAR